MTINGANMETITLNVLIALVPTLIALGWAAAKFLAKRTENKIDDQFIAAVESALSNEDKEKAVALVKELLRDAAKNKK